MANMLAFSMRTEKVVTQSRSQVVDVTPLVARYVANLPMTDGHVVAFVPHTTAGITINENADPDVKADVLRKLDALIPKSEGYYQHAEGNSDSHLKTIMTGTSVTIFVDRGRLVLGRWQGVWFCEYDGPRDRQLLLKAFGNVVPE
ncbi:MAG TPA: secondary thiamine-phosphate synthase enzyme YjbQ [Tepidisphaeraceae bacterium]|nr:secondary thiamine-phosphate synthase enzyme YjbQ [Tepidisphaeraceae bacterium]